ncbi:hypothetical protein AOQ84DRAFT_347436 [Glonium stellatum]|uniref:EH domain-containing protein n=1 Tax=Glonium stellatum TaxID=574774 RepID=A0A8E2ES69_9PEZI|nr:hypothetical protein AOQ84DRAFT_347436 [Glonium stellatum]
MNGVNNTRNPSQTGPTSSTTQYNVRDAALRGASSAFSKPPVKPKPLVNNYTGGNNGALVAATTAGTAHQRDFGLSSPQNNLSPVLRQWTGGSYRPSSSPVQPLTKPNSSGALDVPFDGISNRSSSPSNIAAKLAAARHSPIRPRPETSSSPLSQGRETEVRETLPPTGSVGTARARLNLLEGSSVGLKKSHTIGPTAMDNDQKVFEDVRATDDSPILPTNSLIKMFEKARPTTPVKQRPEQVPISHKAHVPVKSPKPRRKIPLPLTEDSAVLVNDTNQGKEDYARTKPKPAGLATLKTTGESQKPPVKRKSGILSEESTAIHHPSKSLSESLNTTQSTRLTTPPETFASPRSASTNSYQPTSSYQRQSLRQITPHMTGDSLANAMVGAALASSRNVSPSPARSPAPPLPTRHQPKKHHHHPFHSRSPSPTKPKPEPGKLRTTMRKEPSSSDSEDENDRYKRKGKRVLGVGRKHPNKHHEGARKRWRDTITERERKRYEGVWAANKGLFVAPAVQVKPKVLELNRGDEPSEAAWDVHGLVVRDIWMRSRLPEYVLEEVWALVDGREIGRLRREEFVVGMWLIDQRLKGRKLPVKVGESVWGSVKGVGIRVKLGKG